MKAAIIGGGFAGDLHAKALKACGIELTAVVTQREESAASFAAKWGIPLYGTDLRLALGDGIDAVHICTPPTSHLHYAEEIIRAGKNVFCEKPLCIDPEEARQMVGLADKSGAACGVDYNVRYHKAVQRAREIIKSGKFGRPLLIHGSYLQEFHILPTPYGWRYDPELAGGMRAVTEIGSHWIDTAQYVSGRKVTAVSAYFGSFFPERVLCGGMMEKADSKTLPEGKHIRVDSEDAACISFRYEDGAIGNVMLSEISHGRGNRLSLEITCENGSLWWNEEESDELHTAVRGEGINTEVFHSDNEFEETFVSIIEQFYKGSDYPSFREAAQVVDACAAIERSAERGSEWIEI